MDDVAEPDEEATQLMLEALFDIKGAVFESSSGTLWRRR
jgi:hypothetical protein